MIADVIEIIRDTGYSTFPVTDSGTFHGRLLGIITDKDFDVRGDHACTVGSVCAGTSRPGSTSPTSRKRTS